MTRFAPATAGDLSAREEAGTWYTAGSNTNVYSDPREELGATRHVVQTSNRRFRDDEFMIPRHLTERQEKVRVRLELDPEDLPLFPGFPVGAQAWSELRYHAYSFVRPGQN